MPEIVPNLKKESLGLRARKALCIENSHTYRRCFARKQCYQNQLDRCEEISVLQQRKVDGSPLELI